MNPARILVIDDEIKIREVVCSYLEHAGHRVLQAETGRAGLAQFKLTLPDLVVLDLMLPDINGEEVCRIMRRTSALPILMLTAKVDENSLLQGFNIGADDYLTKPFSPRELVARVQALLKRSAPESGNHPPPVAVELCSPDGAIRVNRAECQAFRRGQTLDLTATEFHLLETFLANPGRVFSRDDLIRRALGDDFDGSDRTIDAHIKNLRHKIEDDPRQPAWIQTVHGFGYRLAGRA